MLLSLVGLEPRAAGAEGREAGPRGRSRRLPETTGKSLRVPRPRLRLGRRADQDTGRAAPLGDAQDAGRRPGALSLQTPRAPGPRARPAPAPQPESRMHTGM